jgi:hypothetical protein
LNIDLLGRVAALVGSPTALRPSDYLEKFMKAIVAVIALGLLSAVASAGVTCKIEIAEDPTNPGSRNKVIIEAPVPPSPSNDPNDASRHTYVVVKRDLSSASILPISQEQRYKQEGAGADAGNFLVSLQETITPLTYSIIVMQLDTTTRWTDYLTWKGGAMGTLLPGKPQPEQVLIFDNPTIGFAVVCASEVNK